jgi:hypothetical protein
MGHPKHIGMGKMEIILHFSYQYYELHKTIYLVDIIRDFLPKALML